MTRDRYRKAVKVGLGLMALPLVVSILALAQGSQSGPFLAPAKAGKGCVQPAATMRYTHMVYLKDLRDNVVRMNGRSPATDLKLTGMQSCSECHAGTPPRARRRPPAPSEPLRAALGALCRTLRPVPSVAPRRIQRVLRADTTKPPPTSSWGLQSSNGSVPFASRYTWLPKWSRLQPLFVREFADSQTRIALSTTQRMLGISLA